MDVSNSTGDSTGYRVLGSGGVPPRPAKGKSEPLTLLRKGTLKPNTHIRVEVPAFFRFCTVEFLPVGKQPIKLDLKERGFDKILVSLIPNGENHKPVVSRRRA